MYLGLLRAKLDALLALFAGVLAKAAGSAKRSVVLSITTVPIQPLAVGVPHVDVPFRGRVFNFAFTVDRSPFPVLFNKGSHARGDVKKAALYPLAKRIKAVVFDGRVLHASPPNSLSKTLLGRVYMTVAVPLPNGTGMQQCVAETFSARAGVLYAAVETEGAKEALLDRLAAAGVTRAEVEGWEA